MSGIISFVDILILILGDLICGIIYLILVPLWAQPMFVEMATEIERYISLGRHYIWP